MTSTYTTRGGYTWRSVNYVCVASAVEEVNATHFSELTHGRYDPDHFPAVSTISHNPPGNVSVFPSGCINIAGAKSELEALYLSLLTCAMLSQHTQGNYNVYNFRSSNLVFAIDLNTTIDLDGFYDARANDNDIHWNRKMFVGLCWQPLGLEEGVSLTIFESGCVNIMGLQTIRQVESCDPMLRDVLRFSKR